MHHSSLELALAPIAALLAFGLSGPAAAVPVYLNDQNITVTLVSPAFLTGGAIGNVIDAASPADSEQHSQITHVWRFGEPLVLLFDLGADYDLETFYFWNYLAEDFDVDDIGLTFLDANSDEIAMLGLAPATGPDPSLAEAFAIDVLRERRADGDQ